MSRRYYKAVLHDVITWSVNCLECQKQLPRWYSIDTVMKFNICINVKGFFCILVSQNSLTHLNRWRIGVQDARALLHGVSIRSRSLHGWDMVNSSHIVTGLFSGIEFTVHSNIFNWYGYEIQRMYKMWKPNEGGPHFLSQKEPLRDFGSSTIGASCSDIQGNSVGFTCEGKE